MHEQKKKKTTDTQLSNKPRINEHRSGSQVPDGPVKMGLCGTDRVIVREARDEGVCGNEYIGRTYEGKRRESEGKRVTFI